MSLSKKDISEMVRSEFSNSVMRIDESIGATLVVGAAAAGGIAYMINKQRTDRVTGKVVEKFLEMHLKGFDAAIKKIERMTKLLNSSTDYEKIMKEIEVVEKMLNVAKDRAKTFDYQKYVDEETNSQIAAKWGASHKSRVMSILKKTIDEAIKKAEDFKKSLQDELDNKIDQM